MPATAATSHFTSELRRVSRRSEGEKLSLLDTTAQILKTISTRNKSIHGSFFLSIFPSPLPVL